MKVQSQHWSSQPGPGPGLWSTDVTLWGLSAPSVIYRINTSLGSRFGGFCDTVPGSPRTAGTKSCSNRQQGQTRRDVSVSVLFMSCIGKKTSGNDYYLKMYWSTDGNTDHIIFRWRWAQSSFRSSWGEDQDPVRQPGLMGTDRRQTPATTTFVILLWKYRRQLKTGNKQNKTGLRIKFIFDPTFQRIPQMSPTGDKLL